MIHKIFLKQIGSTVVLLNHSDIFFGAHFYFLWLLEFLTCLKIIFLNFHQEKLSCNAHIKMPYCIQLPLSLDVKNSHVRQ